MSAAFEIAAQLREIVDLAVEHEPQRAVLVGHGHPAAGRQVDDRKTAASKPDALANPGIPIVRATMMEGRGHAGDHRAIDGVGRDLARNATHQAATLPLARAP